MTLRTLLGGVAIVAAVVAAPATPLDAQTDRAHLGPRLTYNFDAEVFGLGAQLGVPIARRLEFYPSFDVYFPESGSLWALNVDVKYRVTADRSADWLYVGGGLNLTGLDRRGTDRTDAGANVLFGVEPLRGRVHPFGEARLILGDGSSFQLAGGLNITLGRH